MTLLPATYLPEAPRLVREVLFRRGFSTDQAEKFLSSKLADLPSPQGKLKDLKEALQILLEAREAQSEIVVFGDYDVDGATSTALLVRSFERLGLKAQYFIPHRVQDGYGVTLIGAQKMLAKFPNAQVVVTCDNGIASFEGIGFLRSKGLKIIVTDHHEVPSKRVDAHAVINPKQSDCAYPEKTLAGVGVAFLLAASLRSALKATDFSLNSVLDLVALGSVCDVAELRGFNRIVVKNSLSRMTQSDFWGLRVLASRASGAATPRGVSVRDLGFFIGPRLNASGRIGEPDLGVRCLLAPDAVTAMRLADQLEEANQKRREMQEEQLQHALSLFEGKSIPSAIVLADEKFHLGIVGLLASKLSEKFKRPACVLTKITDEHELALHGAELAEDLWKGSLRAPRGYHLARILDEVRSLHEGLLKSGGGHAAAAGVALFESKLEAFVGAFESISGGYQLIDDGLEWDAEWQDQDDLAEAYDWLQPFGQGFAPVNLLLKDFKVESWMTMKEKHLKLIAAKGSKRFSILQFNSPWVSMGETWGGSRGMLDISLVGEMTENWWQGSRSMEFSLKEVLELKREGKVLHEFKSSRKGENEIRPGQSL